MPDETYDSLISIQVLEHVEDVHGYLLEANRVLKKGGTLILSTHGWWTYHPYPTDFWRWTRAGLQKVLVDHGFQVEESGWFMGMLAYSTMLKLQCVKGVCEKMGRAGKVILAACSVVCQLLMILEDRITPGSIGRDNAAVYILFARKS